MNTEQITHVEHHTDALFSVKTTRSANFRFRAGEFTMLGLETQPRPIHVEPRPTWRAYSMTSTPYDDFLEFYSIGVPGGEFTTQFRQVQPGDAIYIKTKTTGSLVIDYLAPKQNLVMLATGTGIAPFLSIVQDPETYSKFSVVEIYHTVRNTCDLAHLQMLDDLEIATEGKFRYVESVTQAEYHREGRFWQHLEDLNPESDAVMACGSPAMVKQCREHFQGLGFSEGNIGRVDADFMVERAFAD